MICEKCGAQLPENAKFCLECGTPVKTMEKPEVPQNNFVDLQVEEIDQDSFFGQFSDSPIKEVTPPTIEENPNLVEEVEDIETLKEEVVSDPFDMAMENTQPVAETLPAPDAVSEIPINIPNPIPENPLSAAMPDLEIAEEEPVKNIPTENIVQPEPDILPEEEIVPDPEIPKTIMNSGSVNQVTMGGLAPDATVNESAPVTPINNTPVEPTINRNPDSVSDLLTDSAMNPPPLNKADNSFAQPNFDQYSVNMMYGSNTEEEQYLRMQKEQLQPAKAFEKASNPLPGAGSNVVSDFGNTYGNGLNKNTNINAYQNNMQKPVQSQVNQMPRQPMQRPMANNYTNPTVQNAPHTFGEQLNQTPQGQQQPAGRSTVQDPMNNHQEAKKKSPAMKIIVIILILVIIAGLGYVFFPFISDALNSKNKGSETNEATTHPPVMSNAIVIEEDNNSIEDSNSVNNNNTENVIANEISLNTTNSTTNTTGNTVANVINLNATNN